MKNAPKGKRRDRRTGMSPYARYKKREFEYEWKSPHKFKRRDNEQRR